MTSLQPQVPSDPLTDTAWILLLQLGSAMVFPAYDAIRDQARFMHLTRELKLST
jgi:hypothetical protein